MSWKIWLCSALGNILMDLPFRGTPPPICCGTLLLFSLPLSILPKVKDLNILGTPVPECKLPFMSTGRTSLTASPQKWLWECWPSEEIHFSHLNMPSNKMRIFFLKRILLFFFIPPISKCLLLFLILKTLTLIPKVSALPIEKTGLAVFSISEH